MSARCWRGIHTSEIKQSAKPAESFPDAVPAVRVPTKSPTVWTSKGAESS